MPTPKPPLPKAPSAPKEAADEVQRTLRGLSLFLSQTRGFRLAIALYNDPVEREKFIRTLSGELTGASMQLLVLDLRTVPHGGTLLAGVEELLASREPSHRPLVMVTNLESRVEYNPELAGPSAPGAEFLATANLHRESFSSTCPAPLIIWMTELLERAFIKQAPDLWHWRSHVFDLRTRRLPAQSSTLVDGTASFRSDDARLHPELRIVQLEEELVAYRKNRSSKDEMRVLNAIGLARLDMGEAKLARHDFEATLAIAREIDDQSWRGTALGNLGIAYATLGEARQAIEFYEQQLVIVREISDRRGEGNALGNLGLAHVALGNARQAIEFCEQQLVIVREIDDRRGEGNALGNLGLAHAALGNVRQAIEFYEQSLVIDRETGDRRGEGAALGNLGNAYGTLGETRQAIEFHEQCLVLHREVGDRRGEGSALWNTALAYNSLGEHVEAVHRAEAALIIYDAIEDPNADKVRAQLAEWRGASS